MQTRLVLYVFLIFQFVARQVDAQTMDHTPDSLTQLTDTLISSEKGIIEITTDTLENRPNTAALFSAAVPGLGQAYNNKYWKIPLIYAGGLVVGYYINFNHQLYNQYRDGLIAIRDQDPRTQPFDPNLDEKVYENRTTYWRRNRDLLMIGALLIYVVNIVDANVDAHLASFTVDEDISLNFGPSLEQTAMQTNLYGFSLKLRFN